MKLSYKITSKNRLFLPREIRQILGVKTGDKISIIVEKGIVHLLPGKLEKIKNG